MIHDGYDFNRQQKVKNIVRFCNSQNIKIDVHVCWESQTGRNCCKCEKCYRTILALIAEGAKPQDYGFQDASKTIRDMEKRVLCGSKINQYIARTQWQPIKDRVIENKKILKKSIWWNSIKWIIITDFNNIEKEKLIAKRRIKAKYMFNKKVQNIHDELFRFVNKMCSIK